VNGRVTSRFGQRGRKPHHGIDISARRGSPVRAAAAGKVVFSDRKRNYGRVVILAHAGGYETLYAHNQDNLVWDGTHVKQGQLIAELGSTGNAKGPHLHFEVRHGKRALDPLTCLPLRTTRRP
jgi:murein DD-endopeptidase MepM/ murein hydrolase activator NlpD